MEQTALSKIAKSTGGAWNEEQLATMRETVAKGTSNLQFALFVQTAISVDLNPLVKEMWCYKDGKGNLIIFAGRDGFLKKAQRDPRWNGIVSSEVRENDKFEIDIPAGKIVHSPNYKENRGKIVGAYCMVRPKDADIATIEWVDYETYNKGYSVWKTHPAEMIKKVAETHALKKAFGILGLQSEFDFDVKNDHVEAIETETSKIDQLRDQVVEALSVYQDDDKSDIQKICKDKREAGEDTEEFYREILKQIS